MDILSSLQTLKASTKKALNQITSIPQLTEIEEQLFSRKNGSFSALMATLKDVSDETRKSIGKELNDAKSELEQLFKEVKERLVLETRGAEYAAEEIDVTQPVLASKKEGHLHLVTALQFDIEDFFRSMGFQIAEGPELESEYFNFEAVNVPADHPARDMQDTFFIADLPHTVMRTHTSSVQVRAMRTYGAPLRAIVPGRVFRNEATDPRHEHTFTQLEGMVVDRNITISDLRGVLEALAKHLYGDDVKLRLRPKFYPFVEPGMNGEVTCFLCQGKGCRVCKYSGWMEIFGAGMIHPTVLKEGGIDPEVYQGFAFGFGFSRLVMLKYGIEDVRHFADSDLRFLTQF